MSKWIKKISLWMISAAGICILAIMAVIIYDVISRSLFNAPTTWALEASEFLVVASVFLATSYALLTGAHVRIELVVQHFNQKAQEWLTLLAAVIGIVFSGTLAWQGIKMGWRYLSPQIVNSTSIKWLPMFVPYAAIPLGSALLTLIFIIQINDALKSLKKVTQTDLRAR